jgi:hypothetical protein
MEIWDSLIEEQSISLRGIKLEPTLTRCKTKTLIKESNLTTKNTQKQALKERKSKRNIKEQTTGSGI